MSTCAFCGEKHLAGSNFLAHRMTTTRIRTVKVCPRCVDEASDAGYYVSAKESTATAWSLRTTPRSRI
jgi:hypothetical protein